MFLEYLWQKTVLKVKFNCHFRFAMQITEHVRKTWFPVHFCYLTNFVLCDPANWMGPLNISCCWCKKYLITTRKTIFEYFIIFFSVGDISISFLLKQLFTHVGVSKSFQISSVGIKKEINKDSIHQTFNSISIEKNILWSKPSLLKCSLKSALHKPSHNILWFVIDFLYGVKMIVDLSSGSLHRQKKN